MKEIKCVIMDWAGTAVDYGCFAPLNAFLKVFKEEKGIEITLRQAREPMGMLKIDHIRAILSMPDVTEKFTARYHRMWNEEDVNEMYQSFEKHLFASLTEFTDPIPGVVETLEGLRAQGIRIGSTTGYTGAMMDIVRPGAEAKGYRVDNLVTPDSLPAGRPAPYMIFQNMIDLRIPSVQQVVKVGDTLADIREGVNAGVWSVGLITGSNEMGLTEEEYNRCPVDELAKMKADEDESRCPPPDARRRGSSCPRQYPRTPGLYRRAECLGVLTPILVGDTRHPRLSPTTPSFVPNEPLVCPRRENRVFPTKNEND